MERVFPSAPPPFSSSSSSSSSSRIWVVPSCFPMHPHLSLPVLNPKSQLHRHRAAAWLWNSEVKGRYGFLGQESKCSVSDVSISSEADFIFLDVEGMSCGGCTSSVKKILESQPHVIDASVILATKSAEVKVSLASSGSSKGEIGQALAKHLSNCGFESRVREESA